MFDDLVVSGGRKKRANKWTFFFSFCVQVLLLGVLILVPLIYTEAIDLKQFSSTLLVAPPPPPPPPPPPTAQPIARVRPIARIMQAGKMMAPTVIPKQVAKIIEEDIPDTGGVGVIGGVPGGIPGGQAGGVLGGIIGGVTGSHLPPPPPTPKRIVVGGNVQQARLVSQPRPVYPPLAKQTGLQGTVVLRALIGTDGAVREVQLVSGPYLLAQAAMDAVLQWRYQPTLLNGQPMEVETRITVIFMLNR